MAKLIFHFVLYSVTFVVGCVVSQGINCPAANGTFSVPGKCDAYIECRNGKAEQKLCPDGLLFNEKVSGYPCGYPIDVICNKGTLQPAQPTDECPHQFGYFEMGDQKKCGHFKNCASGRAYIFYCPDGLAWNKNTYKCDWPDQVEGCDSEAFLGFKCPSPPVRSSVLGEEEYKFYPDIKNCQQYFICIESRPRRISCGDGQAFNQETNQCEDIENVSNCSTELKQLASNIKTARALSQNPKHLQKSALLDAQFNKRFQL